MTSIEKMTNLLKGIKDGKYDREKIDEIKNDLTPEECELIEVAVGILVVSASYGADKMVTLISNLIDSKNPEDDGTLSQCFEYTAKFGFHPLYLYKILKALNIQITPGFVLKSIVEHVMEGEMQKNCKFYPNPCNENDSCESQTSSPDMDAIIAKIKESFQS